MDIIGRADIRCCATEQGGGIMKTARLTGFILICVCFVYSALAGVALGETCAEGAKACSEDAYSAKRCEGGEWKVIECMKEEGKIGRAHV